MPCLKLSDVGAGVKTQIIAADTHYHELEMCIEGLMVSLINYLVTDFPESVHVYPLVTLHGAKEISRLLLEVFACCRGFCKIKTFCCKTTWKTN